MKKSIFLILIITMISLSGCVIEINDDALKFNVNDENIDIQVKRGELKTFTEEFALDDQKRLDVYMKINAAKTSIERSSDALFKAEVNTDIVGLTPEFQLKGDNLIIKDNFEFKKVGNAVNDWELQITDKIPISLDIESNATRNNYDFTGMNIEDISLVLNASSTNIRFDEKNRGDLQKFDIKLNAGDVEISGLDNAAAEVMGVDVNAGNIELFFGDNLDKDMEISIQANVASVDIRLPKNVGVLVEKNSNLMSLNINYRDYEKISDIEYKSDNYDIAKQKIHVNIKGNASSIEIR